MAGAKAKTKKKPPAKSPARAKPKTKSATAARAKPKAKPAPRAKTSARAKPPAPRTKPASRARPAPAAKPAPSARPAPEVDAGPAPEMVPAAQVVRVATKPLQAGDFVLEKLQQVALTATNLDISVEFYRDILGLKFMARFDPPGLAFFALSGGARLLLSATASQATLYFSVDDIDTAMNALKKRGVTFLHPPAMIHRDVEGEFGKRDMEEWMAFFRDPSGNLLGLVERR
jgi:catechol 2,3-dioxygenase-like lactoylglutathione lyase family enzyme